FLLSSAFCFSQHWTPNTDRALYERAMAEVAWIEPFSKFLELEKTTIKTPSPRYYQARWAFIKDVYHDNPQVSHPNKALDKFILFCTENNLLGTQKEEFIKAAKILGFELITDKVAFEAPSGTYKEHLKTEYVYHNGYPQNLDLFVPNTAITAPVPCIIFIHGGAWSGHKRAWFEGFARYTASKGYAAATIDYRLLHAIDSPLECVYDAKAAVRWIRANAKRYHIDPNKIGVAGASAGGHLAAMLATTADEADLEGGIGNLHVSSEVQAAVGLATPALTGKRFSWPWMKGEKPKWFDTISPYRYISEGDAPMKFIHGTEDNTVAPDDAKDLYEAYTKKGLFTELELVQGKGHVFYMNQETAEKVLDFMKRVFEDGN
ncbi:MAG: alpha/beta hydrolase, partial [Bacteroidota bacterium]